MKLKRFFWIGIAVAGAAAVIACGGDSGPGASPEQELGAELARASQWTVVLEHGTGANIGAAQGAWSAANFLYLSNSSAGIFPPLEDLGDLFGTGAEVDMEVVERLSRFSDVLVLANNGANRALFEDFNDAQEEALLVLAGASWVEPSHYREVMIALRDAREALEAAARPRGNIDRLRLLAAIHDASVMYFQTSASLVFNPDERVMTRSGLGWDEGKFYAFRAPRESMQAMEDELRNAATVAFNDDTLRPVDHEAVRLAAEALQLRSDIFARDRQENERWIRLMWGIAATGASENSAAYNAGTNPDGWVDAITGQQLRPTNVPLYHVNNFAGTAGLVTAVLSPNLQTNWPLPLPADANRVTWTFVNPANNQPYPAANNAGVGLAPIGWTLQGATATVIAPSTVNTIHGGNWIAQMEALHDPGEANAVVTARIRATVGTGDNAVHAYIDVRATPAIEVRDPENDPDADPLPSNTLLPHPDSGSPRAVVLGTTTDPAATAAPLTASQLNGSGGITWIVAVFTNEDDADAATAFSPGFVTGRRAYVQLTQRTVTPTITVANLNELRLEADEWVVIYAMHATGGLDQVASPGRSASIEILAP